jgi:hypothetical protein
VESRLRPIKGFPCGVFAYTGVGADAETAGEAGKRACPLCGCPSAPRHCSTIADQHS